MTSKDGHVVAHLLKRADSREDKFVRGASVAHLIPVTDGSSTDVRVHPTGNCKEKSVVVGVDAETSHRRAAKVTALGLPASSQLSDLLVLLTTN